MWIYFILWALCGLWAWLHINDTDEKGYFKTP